MFKNLMLFVWLPIFHIVVKHVKAVDWSQVKPMYMVPMFPPPASMYDTWDYANRPMILDLETETMEPDMLPGGVVAMNRIFGGSVASTKSFPYQVGLLLQRPKGLYWCGGSLISDEHVLTAAHCVDMAKRALVFLGAHEIKNEKEYGQMRMKVTHKDFIIFPTWNPRRLKDDIAIVRLPDTIRFTEKIQPIQLPKSTYEYRTFRNKLAIASGWGRYATGVHAISNVLRYVDLRIVDDRTCKRSFPLAFRATNICTSGKKAKSTCNGDSGGPLVLRRRNSKKRVLVGITSFGSIHGCDRGFPAAFTKVASYLDWISDETGVDPSYQETSNAMLLSQYLRDYKRKVKRREEEHYLDKFDDKMPDDPKEVEPIYLNLHNFDNIEMFADQARKRIRKM